MLVVLVILGLTAVLIVSHGSPRSGGASQSAAATDIVQNLRLARSRAIAHGTTSAVVIDATRHLLLIDGVAQRPLPPGIAISLDAGDGHRTALAEFRFTPDGSARGGVITLGRPPLQIRIAVNWLSGAVETSYAP